MQTAFAMGLIKKSEEQQSGSSKKRILFVVNSLRIGGAEKICCNICDNLDYNLFDINVISISKEIPLADTLANRSKITIYSCGQNLNVRYPFISPRTFMKFLGQIRKIKPQIVHSHLWGISCACFFAFLVSHPKPVFIATIHSSGFIYTSQLKIHKIYRHIENFCYKILKFNLVSISDAVDKMVRCKLNYRTLEMITNGINLTSPANSLVLNDLKLNLKLDSAFPIIIHVGRASSEKRQEDIILALPQILTKFPHARLILAGRDNSRMHSDLVNRLNINQKVLLLDERNDVPQLLQISDIGVFPSLYEGFPLALAEMMAAGLPLIVSDIPALRDITGKGLAALYVPTKSPDAISKSIIKVLENPELHKSLSRNAVKIAAENFSVFTMVRKYERLYTSLSKN